MTETKNELTRNAIALARKKELDSDQLQLDRKWIDARMADGNTSRLLVLIHREDDLEKDFKARTDHAAIVNARSEKEIALGRQIALEKRMETNKLQRRHLLRDRDPELRDMIKHMEGGYVGRDQRMQILNNEYKRHMEKEEEIRKNEFLQSCLHRDDDPQSQIEAAEKNMKYLKELQQQLVNRQQEKQCQYEEKLIEKKMMDDVIRTMNDEDHKERNDKHALREKLRKEMVTFGQARNAWKEKQKILLVKQEREIEEQKKAFGDRSASIVAAKQEQLRQRDLINQKICAKKMADEKARLEKMNLITLLQEQEYLEKNIQDDIREFQKIERVKRETKDALQRQMQTRIRDMANEREREIARKEIGDKYIKEVDAKELEKERLKKERSLQYSRDLKKQIEDNKMKRQKEKKREDQRATNVFECLKAWYVDISKVFQSSQSSPDHEGWNTFEISRDKEVDVERKKILGEHMPQVGRFLRHDAIRKEERKAFANKIN